MNVTSIIPLAGPDFISKDKQVKALKKFKDGYLLNYILKSRPWFLDIKNYIFVLHDNDVSRNFANEHLLCWFPGCRLVYLSDYTKGAALTTLAATSFCDANSPIVVDLGDIYYQINENIFSKFKINKKLGAIVPTFESASESYSYLKFNEKGEFIDAREKDVISNYATAGTYIYKNPSVLITSIAWHLSCGQSYKHNDLYYLSPTLNGIKAAGREVKMVVARHIHDIKKAETRV